MSPRVWAPLAVLALALACDSPVGTDAGRAVIDWRVESPSHFDLVDLSGTSADALVAVGAGGTALQYDGSQWTELDATFGPEDRSAVWSTGASEFFMADGTRPAIYRCESSGCITYADLPGDVHAFTDLWASAPDDVFAVGAGNGDILHFDGESWSTMAGQIPNGIRGLWGFGPDQVWAAGYSGLMHYDGVEWTPVETGLDPAAYTNLVGIWGSDPDNVFALDGDPWGSGSDVLHFDGTGWQALEVTGSATLTAIWGSSPTNVYVVGEKHHSSSVFGVIFRYNGSTWVELDTPTSTPLEAVWGTSGRDVWVAGQRGMILHYDGFTWSVVREMDGVGSTLNAVTGSADGTIWAVGEGTVVRRMGGLNWAPQGADRGGDVAAAGTAVYVVAQGRDGSQVIHFEYGLHETIDAPEIGIQAIWCASSTDLVVVGTYWVDRFRSRWSEAEEYRNANERLMDVWGADPDDIYAVGTTVVHFDGEEWTEVPVSRMGYQLAAVWGSSGDDVFAVGDDGVIVHWDGLGWRSMESGTYADLHGVWGDSPRNVYAVGAVGTLLHYDGEAWAPVELPLRITADLNDVWLDAASDLFIVGEAGTILRGDR